MLIFAAGCLLIRHTTWGLYLALFWPGLLLLAAAYFLSVLLTMALVTQL